MHKPFPAASVGRVIADGGDVLLGNIRVFAMTTPGHTPGAVSWRWESCDGGVCRTIVYADSLTPVSRDDYRFSDPDDSGHRASIAKIAEARETLADAPSVRQLMKERMIKQPLFDPDGCKNMRRPDQATDAPAGRRREVS
jgi:metallo-beta-lactamase class B